MSSQRKLLKARSLRQKISELFHTEKKQLKKGALSGRSTDLCRSRNQALTHEEIKLVDIGGLC